MPDKNTKPLKLWKKEELIEFIETTLKGTSRINREAQEAKELCDKYLPKLQNLAPALETASANVGHINGHKKESEDSKTKIDIVAEDVKKSQENINSFHNELFNDEDPSDENPMGIEGIKTQIENFQKNMEENTKEQMYAHKEEHKKLIETIEALLPRAASAGLAASFLEAKKDHSRVWPMWFGFIFSLVVLFATYLSSFGFTPWYSPDHTGWLSVIFRLSFGAPSIWLAWFCQKNISETKRIREEYEHKERIMTLYEGFMNQIRSIENSDNEQAKLLVQILLEAISLNPAQKINTQGSPLDSATSAVKSTFTGNTPG